MTEEFKNEQIKSAMKLNDINFKGYWREDEEYIDLPSFVDWWFIEELVRNLDAAVPRSDYMYKDQLGKLFAGPVWDFDYSTFIPYGNFVCKNAIYYNRLFSDPVFVSLVKDRWALLKTKFETVPDYIRIVADRMLIPNTINISIWPINSNTNGDESMSYSDAIDRMVNNYIDRLNWLDFQINHM